MRSNKCNYHDYSRFAQLFLDGELEKRAELSISEIFHGRCYSFKTYFCSNKLNYQHSGARLQIVSEKFEVESFPNMMFDESLRLNYRYYRSRLEN